VSAAVLAFVPRARAECGHFLGYGQEAILVHDCLYRVGLNLAQRLLCPSCALVAAQTGLSSAMLAEALGLPVPAVARAGWLEVVELCVHWDDGRGLA